MEKFDPKFPYYNDDSDYNTNANSYYKDLGRKTKLIKLLAKRIWEYDERLDNRLEELESVLNDYLSQWDKRIDELDEEVSHIFVEWLEDGTLEQIINDDVLGNKADKTYVDELNKNVTTQLAKNASITPMEYGAKGDGVTDDYQALLDTFEMAMTNGYDVNLLDNKTYLINSKNTNLTGRDLNLFEITSKIEIKGKSTIKVGVIGDYYSVFRLRGGASGSKFLDFTIDENTKENNTTMNDISPLPSERGAHRITFYGNNGTRLQNLEFTNITIKGCIGVWQLQTNADHVSFINSRIEYATENGGFSPIYDRTCFWEVGNNWVVRDNEFIGSDLAFTAVEIGGRNNVFDNNKVVDFSSSLYILNNIEQTSTQITNNHFECRKGLQLWFTWKGVNVESITLKNNTFIVQEDTPAILTKEYNLEWDSIIENVSIVDNKFYLNTTEHEFIRIHNAQAQESTVPPLEYKHMKISNNEFYGVCKSPIHFGIQPSNRVIFNRLDISDNKFHVENQTGNRLISMYDMEGGFNEINIKRNDFSVDSLSTMSNFFLFYGIAEPDQSINYVTLEGNKYSVPMEFSLSNHYGQRYIKMFETMDVDLLDIQYLVSTENSYHPYSGVIKDIFGQTMYFKDGEIARQVFRMASVPTTNHYKRGDYVYNTSPTVLNFDGDLQTVKGWLRTSDSKSGHDLGTHWIEDIIHN